MARRYTGGFISATEQVTDANSANGVYTLAEAQAKTSLGEFPIGRWTPQRSLRFRAAGSTFLSRTPASAGNQKTWTWSGWVKRGTLTTDQVIFGVGNTYIRWHNGAADGIWLNFRGAGGTNYFFQTTASYRDPSAWYHIVLATDTTQTIAANRVKLYVNGVQITAFTTYADYPPQNYDTGVNSTALHTLGSYPGPIIHFDGYLSEINLIDGQALSPSAFAFTDPETGTWVPKRYTGTYGTNGFYLPFESNTTSSFAGSFNGSNQSLSIAQNAAFSFGTGDFTVEAWVYGNSWRSDSNPIISLGDGAVGGGSPVYSGWAMRYDTNNGIGFYRFDGTETFLTSGAFLSTNKWNHIAISRSSGTLRMFANGVQVYSAANSISYNNVNANTLKIGGNWVIGGGVVTWVNGFISNVRIVKGTSLYNSNFTPSVTNLTAVTGTSLLTLQNASIVDNSTNAFSITNNNSVTTSVQYPFTLNIASDYSGNNNSLTPNNISTVLGATYDSMVDVPGIANVTSQPDVGGVQRGNYCTFNPLAVRPDASPSTATFTNGNLKATFPNAGGNVTYAPGTQEIVSGKFYWEIKKNDDLDLNIFTLFHYLRIHYENIWI
jgi:hypothetical protein